ncbi:hypothetical protein [Methylobacterium sp. SD21]|uniref:hypothetical protein n=1 Tax=Methylobacterium litchii TaxID=3138810 RepID=UPI00313A7881
MAWIELTDSTNHKVLVNTDQIVRIDHRFNGGSILHTVATRNKEGRLISNFEVQEDQTTIETIMSKAQIVVSR